VLYRARYGHGCVQQVEWRDDKLDHNVHSAPTCTCLTELSGTPHSSLSSSQRT